MQRYFIELSYKGTDFHGWQIQPNGISVQQVLDETLTQRLSRPIYVTGSGRTDAGVHASQQFAHFDTEGELPEIDMLVYSLNNMLPDGIAIHHIFPVEATTHARFSATARYYQYHIRRQKSPFLAGLSYIFRPELDVALMNAAAAKLLEHSNFRSFSKVRTNVNHYHCRIMRAEWEQRADELVFHIKADRFLYGMVRCLVGTLLDVGQGRMTVDQFVDVIRAEDRTAASRAVPASGLFLTEVSYPDGLLEGSSTSTV
ncbi:tRNA pseudouridine(38-40) synthase TruA [Fibrella sp. HMF5335]|uniref:tRNA pseudouridine synthase A n=1 Tax=Fibrella rubiginis TaxID=2817060 RepID=A0A939GIA7_9BACT|nr:tRNA pseudouridine(38-40) synthase TruA [Fibrella rubiginis]MBO0939702.1 tRNA pseudouridine(38-40) synthase TruA [Fibrella rubiginis]